MQVLLKLIALCIFAIDGVLGMSERTDLPSNAAEAAPSLFPFKSNSDSSELYKQLGINFSKKTILGKPIQEATIKLIIGKQIPSHLSQSQMPSLDVKLDYEEHFLPNINAITVNISHFDIYTICNVLEVFLHDLSYWPVRYKHFQIDYTDATEDDSTAVCILAVVLAKRIADWKQTAVIEVLRLRQLETVFCPLIPEKVLINRLRNIKGLEFVVTAPFNDCFGYPSLQLTVASLPSTVDTLIIVLPVRIGLKGMVNMMADLQETNNESVKQLRVKYESSVDVKSRNTTEISALDVLVSMKPADTKGSLLRGIESLHALLPDSSGACKMLPILRELFPNLKQHTCDKHCKPLAKCHEITTSSQVKRDSFNTFEAT